MPPWKVIDHHIEHFIFHVWFTRCPQVIFECTESDFVCVYVVKPWIDHIWQKKITVWSPKEPWKRKRTRKGAVWHLKVCFPQGQPTCFADIHTHIYILDHLKKAYKQCTYPTYSRITTKEKHFSIGIVLKLYATIQDCFLVPVKHSLARFWWTAWLPFRDAQTRRPVEKCSARLFIWQSATTHLLSQMHTHTHKDTRAQW